ncbi:hypothetical protein PVAND_011989 [Polypedilum vanderplanki]|uniref:SAP30-binding protein n=1 Tax=Polypedilum vanderplanki TaxID=319348 RepID=A0A9J6CK82_POLVA|nr:hypothetical protein PVAND_011989 [Polypedilum vanderplanki]
MNSALASLTACYTDSENEDHHDDDDDVSMSHSDPEEKQIKGELVIQQQKTSNNNPKKSLRLVSYNDNEEHEEIHDEEHHSDEESEENKEEQKESIEIDSEDKNAKYIKKYGFSLPEPKSKPNPKLQENVTKITQRMLQNPNYDLNKFVQDNKSFRNPSIYDKLIQHCSINELGTNFSPEYYDVSIYGPESYYEELAKAQKAEMDKHEKQKKENIKTEVIVKEGKRKSKWDVQSSDGKLVSQTSSSSKTTTVIQAFGSLKKPKV